jgi:hypothetical protein
MIFPIRAPGPTPFGGRKEITQQDDMNDKVFNIDVDTDMKMWDIARNAIGTISFDRFHGQRNPTTYI